jgi:hypothetical protein
MAEYMNSLSGVVAKIVADAKMDAIQMFIDDISSYMNDLDLDDEVITNMTSHMTEFKEAMAAKNQNSIKESTKISKKISKKAASSDSGDSSKKKRAPSMFNLFVKDKMIEIKNSSDSESGGSSKAMMSRVSEMWKVDEFATFIKDNSKDYKKKYPDADNMVLFKRMKADFKGESNEDTEAETEADEVVSDSDVKPKTEKKEKSSAPKKKSRFGGKKTEKKAVTLSDDVDEEEDDE